MLSTLFFRIHRKEVEGALLEVVPEEVLSAAAAVTNVMPVAPLLKLASASSIVVGPPDNESTPCTTSAAQFHIPDSNMSEAGYSECSLQSEHVLPYRQVLTKTEALSAKQQVTFKLGQGFPTFKRVIMSTTALFSNC